MARLSTDGHKIVKMLAIGDDSRMRQQGWIQFFYKSLYRMIIIETSIVKIEFVYCLPTSTRSTIHYFSGKIFSEVIMIEVVNYFI